VSDARRFVGDVVSVQGLVSTIAGEKVITPKYFLLSRNAPRPVFANSAALHGQTGLDVFGLLVRAVGVIGVDLGSGVHEFVDDAGKTILLDSNGHHDPRTGHAGERDRSRVGRFNNAETAVVERARHPAGAIEVDLVALRARVGRRVGFSLMELLVVVAIIAIIAGILYRF